MGHAIFLAIWIAHENKYGNLYEHQSLFHAEVKLIHYPKSNEFHRILYEVFFAVIFPISSLGL